LHPHPFSEVDWQRVVDACRLITNAVLADDSVLSASRFADLADVLEDLRRGYGEHPAIDEVEADFTEDPQRQIYLYERAIEMAENNGLATGSIRVSMASTFLEDFGDAKRAAAELSACQLELFKYGDDYARRQWTELWEVCSARLNGGGK
jgi:hypothetical protein